MRISGSGRISRASALAAATLVAASALAACSSSPAPTVTAVPGGGGGAGASDIQLLAALSLTSDSLSTAFNGETWSIWSPTAADISSIGATILPACKADIDLSKASQHSATYFESVTQAPTAPTTTPTKSGKHSNPTTPPPATTSTVKDWVDTVAAVFPDSASATAALKSFGSLQNAPSTCGGPADSTPGQLIVGTGQVDNTWYGDKAMVIAVDPKQGIALSAVAQVRGRFVVVVYTAGAYQFSAASNYYILNGTDDTTNASAAATEILSQLTNSVVNVN